MIVRRFEDKDFTQLKEWGAQWGSEYDEDQFPNTGFIIDGIGAYFLYGTDSAVCWLENMVTRRGIDPATRARAVDLLIEAAFKEAKDQGYKVAYASTGLVGAAKRARDHGAAVTPNQFLLTKDLTKNTHLQ